MLGRVDRNLLLALCAGGTGFGGDGPSSTSALSSLSASFSAAQLLESRSRSLGSAAVFGNGSSSGSIGGRSAGAAAAAAAISPPLLLSPERTAALATRTPPGPLSPASLPSWMPQIFGADGSGAEGSPPPPAAPQSPPMPPR